MRVFNIAILLIMLISGCSQPDIATETKSNNVERVRTKDTLIIRDSVTQKVTTNIRQRGDTIIISKYVYERSTTDRTSASGRDTFYINSDTIVKYYPKDIQGDYKAGRWLFLVLLLLGLAFILVRQKNAKN